MTQCEVCWAKDSETTISEYKGLLYCDYDLERAIAEGWSSNE